jgi:hypothetical protein
MDWWHGEPTLTDALADPLVQAIMSSDRVDENAVLSLMHDVARLRALFGDGESVTDGDGSA